MPNTSAATSSLLPVMTRSKKLAIWNPHRLWLSDGEILLVGRAVHPRRCPLPFRLGICRFVDKLYGSCGNVDCCGTETACFTIGTAFKFRCHAVQILPKAILPNVVLSSPWLALLRSSRGHPSHLSRYRGPKEDTSSRRICGRLEMSPRISTCDT